MEVFKRDESTMHIASTGVIWFSAVAWVVLLIGVVFLFADVTRLAGAVVLFLVAGYWVFSECYYTFQEGVSIQFKGSKVHYEYLLNRGVVPSGDCHVRIDIKNIKKVKVKGKKAVVYGEVMIKQPLVKVKFRRKADLYVNFGENRDKVIERLNSCIGGA